MIGIGLSLPQAALGGGGGVPLAQIQALFSAENGVIHDLTNSASVFQERTGASATTPSGDNGPIGSLKDWSPNNNWATAPSDVARPLYRLSQYAISDGIDDTMVTSALVAAQPITRVACWQLINAGAPFDSLFEQGPASLELYAQAGSITSYGTGEGILFGSVSAGQYYVTTEIFNGASSKAALNNNAYVTGSTGLAPSAFFRLFAENGSSGFSELRYVKAISIGKLLIDPEIALCRTWAGQSVGLVL